MDALIRHDYCNHGALRVPRGLAAARVRVFARLRFDPSGNYDVDTLAPLAARTDPLQADEAKLILESELAKRHSDGVLVRFMVQELEALLGPEVLLSTLCDYAEAADAQYWQAFPSGSSSLWTWVGFGLLRAERLRSDQFRSRLRAVLERVGPFGLDSVGHQLDLAVRGAAAIRADERPAGSNYLLTDDASLVVAKVTAEPIDRSYRIDPRLAFLGGDPVLRHYTETAPKVKAVEFLRDAIEPFAQMASSDAVSLLLALATSSKVKKEAAAYLLEHRSALTADLEKAAASGAFAATAAAVLKKKR